MTRAGLAPGDIGTPAYINKPDGKVLARVRYRRFDGTEARISRVGSSKAAARRAVMEAARERMTDAIDPAQSLTADSTVAELATAYLEVQHERDECVMAFGNAE